MVCSLVAVQVWVRPEPEGIHSILASLWVVRAQVLGVSPAAFLGALVGSRIGGGATGTSVTIPTWDARVSRGCLTCFTIEPDFVTSIYIKFILSNVEVIQSI